MLQCIYFILNFPAEMIQLRLQREEANERIGQRRITIKFGKVRAQAICKCGLSRSTCKWGTAQLSSHRTDKYFRGRFSEPPTDRHLIWNEML